MNTTQIVGIGIALVSGVSAGFVTGVNVNPSPEKAPTLPASISAEQKVRDVEFVTRTNIVTVTVTNSTAAVSRDVPPGDDAKEELNRLRVELANARQALGQRETELATKQKEEEERRQAWEERRQRRGEDFRQRVERMKEEEPERYAEMVKQREEFRQRMTQTFEDRAMFLWDLDTSEMTEEEKAGHDEILKRINSTWEIVSREREKGEVPAPPNREQRGTLHENYHVMRDLYDQERDYVLRQVATSIGYDTSGAADFSAYIQEVFDLTSPPSMRGRRGSRGGPGGGR